MKHNIGPWTFNGLLDKQPKLRKISMRFGPWNMRILYRAGSLMSVAKQVSKYKSDWWEYMSHVTDVVLNHEAYIHVSMQRK
jgi:hypothetical protein